MDKLRQCLTTLTVKKCFLMFKWYFMYNLCPLPIPLSLGTTKSLSLLSSFSPIRYIRYTLMRSPSLSFLISKLNSSSSHSLSSQERCSNKTVILGALHWTLSSTSMPLLCWGALDWTEHSRRGFTTTKQRGRITSLPMQPGVRLAFFCCEGMLNVHTVHQDPKVLLRKAAFQLIHPQYILVQGGCYFSQPAGLGIFPYGRSNFCLYRQGNTLVVFLE